MKLMILTLTLATAMLLLGPAAEAAKLKCPNCTTCEMGKCSPCKCKPVRKT